MGDAWIIRYSEDSERRYLYELLDNGEVWVSWPQDAATFTNAKARALCRSLGEGRDIKPVRKFEEVAR
jgi:hypothetical protein